MGKDLRSQVGVLAFGRCVDGGGPGQSSAAEEVGGRDRARMGNFARAGGATSSARLVWRQEWVSFVNRDGSRCLRGQAQSPSQSCPRSVRSVPGTAAAAGTTNARTAATRISRGTKTVGWGWRFAAGVVVDRLGWRVEGGRSSCWWVWTRDSVAAAVRSRGLWRPKVPLVPWLVIPGVRGLVPERIDVEWRCRCGSRGV